ncbi:xanthine dehydrogenase molybdopterin binding subunit [Limnohabitans sp.]|uniref:xanthine dehydrogenase molybdopterin binding subunit n=1 Tax=Limnohabitans sp. TaxID=1907725 RepID=UPI00286EB804|nr:xanthine dehydrogenase molybdopterin binding subunit [Limnohabitans sp.]
MTHLNHHESATAQINGSARYIDDLPEVQGTLHAAPILSPVAHGRVLGLNTTQALASSGVCAIIGSRDIVGDKKLASFNHDEAIFADTQVQHVGHVMGLVIADSHKRARMAARMVQPDIQALPAVLEVRQAYAQQHWVLPPVCVQRGDAEQAIATAPHVIRGSLDVGGQEHFYLEGQIAYAIPQDSGQWLIHSSTQHPGEVQHWVAHALGIPLHAVRVVCRRMGGGFGGKETQAGHLAVWAAVAAKQLQRPVKMRLDRDDDFVITGKRHPFSYDYTVGFDDTGRILGLHVVQLADCGHSADLSGPVADRAVFHTDNAYFLEHVRIDSYRCKTHKQSHTAFRGFGGPQGMIVTETLLGDIARQLKLDPLVVRERNFYGTTERNTTHYGTTVTDNILAALVSQLSRDCHYSQRRAMIQAWNQNQPTLKRGLALTPVKFGISFTATQFNQAGALVHIYTDGSVLVHHGGTEMGQGLHTKVARIVAHTLGISTDRVRVGASDTDTIPNASATAASSGTDLNGRAAEFAAVQVRDNLARFVATLDACKPSDVRFENDHIHTPARVHRFVEVIAQAYNQRVQLWSDGYYRTPKIHYDKNTLSGTPFYYFAYGAACTEVAIDTLTGEQKVLRVDILHDVGNSIHPAIDIGQIEGGFIQGMGWLTNEELVWDEQGALRTHAPSTYKIPTVGDTPAHFSIKLWHEANRENNVMGSKAVGEPPFMLALSVLEALRDAVANARADQQAIHLNAPATPERVLRALQP